MILSLFENVFIYYKKIKIANVTKKQKSRIVKKWELNWIIWLC